MMSHRRNKSIHSFFPSSTMTMTIISLSIQLLLVVVFASGHTSSMDNHRLQNQHQQPHALSLVDRPKNTYDRRKEEEKLRRGRMLNPPSPPAGRNRLLAKNKNDHKSRSNFFDVIESRVGDSTSAPSITPTCPVENFQGKTIIHAFSSNFGDGNSTTTKKNCYRIQLFDGGTFSMDGNDSDCSNSQFNSTQVFSTYQSSSTGESLLLGPTSSSVSSVAYFNGLPNETLGWTGEFKFLRQTSGSSSNELKVEIDKWKPSVNEFTIHFILPSCDADQPFILSVDTPMPSHQASFIPSALPSPSPLTAPSAIPSILTSEIPSTVPSPAPSGSPSRVPTKAPSSQPTGSPSIAPTGLHSNQPSSKPSFVPSDSPSLSPLELASQVPSTAHSSAPSVGHSNVPSVLPSVEKSSSPSKYQSPVPSYTPSVVVSMVPSSHPSSTPSEERKGRSNSLVPTTVHSTAPSMSPSVEVSWAPSLKPSVAPSSIPSSTSSSEPSSTSSSAPSKTTSNQPSSSPTTTSSDAPSFVPSLAFSNVPSSLSSNSPTESAMPSGAPSLIPSQFPTLLPSSTPSVSSIPSLMPTVTRSERPSLSGCTDYNGDFNVTELSNNPKNCEWAGSNSKLKERRCSFSGVARLCRKTCGVCTETPTTIPSAAPSWKPTPTRAPVEVEATISMKLGPVNGEVMTEANQKLLEDTINASLNERFVSTTPKIEIVKTTTKNQVVKQVSRRLSSIRKRTLQQTENLVLFFDLIVEGNFEPIGAAGDENSFTTAGDVQFDEQLETFFGNSTYSERLIEALTDNTSSASEYFQGINEIVYTTIDPNSYKNPNNGGGDGSGGITSFFTNNVIIIAISAVSACVIIILLVGMYMYTKRRRTRQNEVVDEFDEAVVQSNPSNQSWIDLQPTQPYLSGSNLVIEDDDLTDAGRSVKTFNTLEKIYSGDDQMSFQSYGYSLDDGIVSTKRASTPTSARASGSSDKPDFDRDSVDISLASPGDSSSVYSGLTNEDRSLKAIGSSSRFKAQTEDYTEEEEEDPLKGSLGLPEFERVCAAPPGKLGVVIDTTKMGPVVYQVKDGSPLQGAIFPGDRIIAVDDIDTRGMTASNITKIMARKADLERKIKVLSKKELK